MIMTAKRCHHLKRNLEDCPCEHDDCPRRGYCCECIRWHHGQGDPTACEKKAGLSMPKADKKKQAAGDGKTMRLMDFASCAG